MLFADVSIECFVAISDFPNETQKSVMPVVAFKENQLRLLGTCFAISNHGLVLTARHVLDEALSITDGAINGSGGYKTNGWWVGALYVSKPTPQDDVSDLVGGIIPANRVHTNSQLDIGLMHLNLPVRIDDNSPIEMPALILSPALPEIGQNCLAMGYHNMISEIESSNATSRTIGQNYSASHGLIEEIHFPNRDKISLSFPCFRTTSRFDLGMSGAPIISEKGGVIGVVCSSFDLPSSHGYISYGSLIGPALFLVIDSVDSQGIAEQRFLYDFVTGGAVKANETIQQLLIRRQENVLEIDFGIKPVYRGIIAPKC